MWPKFLAAVFCISTIYSCLAICQCTPLILTEFINNNNASAGVAASKINLSDFQSIESYSGFFTVNSTFNSNLFFWFVPSQNNASADPVILWLQGGPGGSSLVSLFLENGPFIVDSTLNVSLRDPSWSKNYSVLFIDNPVGTGFSFTNDGSFAQNETIIAQHLYSALTQFFLVFSDYQQNDFYVAGESYAGKFVPTLGAKIHTQNQGEPTVKINLKGFILGDGISNPRLQNQYSEVLSNFNLIDEEGNKTVAELENQYLALIDEGNYSAAFELYDKLINGDFQTSPTLFTNLTGYSSWLNVLKPVSDVDFLSVYQYLSQQTVKDAIHVGNTTFLISNTEVENQLKNDIMKDVVTDVETLLNNNYTALLYSGQFDIIVPYANTVKYIQSLSYSTSNGFSQATRHIWQVNGDLAGYIRQTGVLTEAMVRNAGHAAIIDQPKWVFSLVQNFTNNNWNF